ncbi:hypothetical protein EON65_19095 [archaeon]|nr:MAG: hypothetical protein EON65_19095 [archaeon]
MPTFTYILYLHNLLCSRYGNMDIIRYLVEECQADLRIETKLRHSALTVTNFIQVQEYLISKGAVL